MCCLTTTDMHVPKWVLHIVGPDDVIEQPDELTALREANKLNKGILARRLNDGKDPLCVAVVKDETVEEL